MFTKKRPDGTYIRNLHYAVQVMPYLMPTRTIAAIYSEQKFNITKTLEYISRRRKNDNSVKISLFYIFLYSALRVLAVRPNMNRFVSGYRYYQRNRISFNFIAKRGLTDEGEEVNVTVSFSPFLSLEEFCTKLHNYISSIKTGSSTSIEKTNLIVSRLPRFLIRLFVWGIKFLDYHNGLPKSAINSLPFYSSIFFTNTGSIGIDAPFHHNFEIGNCGLFCAIGKIKKENVLNKDGMPEVCDILRTTFTFDDRITDGIYCARSIDMVRDLVENPEKLEIPLELTPEQLKSLALAESELIK